MTIVFLALLVAAIVAWGSWHLLEFLWDCRQFRHFPDGSFLMNLNTMPATHLFYFTPEITAVDVRPAAQFAKCHLPNARNAPFEGGFVDDVAIRDLPTDRPILVYCDGGYRSRKAIRSFTARGFRQSII